MLNTFLYTPVLYSSAQHGKLFGRFKSNEVGTNINTETLTGS